MVGAVGIRPLETVKLEERVLSRDGSLAEARVEPERRISNAGDRNRRGVVELEALLPLTIAKAAVRDAELAVVLVRTFLSRL